MLKKKSSSKKVVPVAEDEKKTTVKRSKKKKVTKKPSTALVLHEPSGVVVTDEHFGELVDSSFDTVYQLLEVNDTDNATQLLYKRVIQSSYKMLGRLETLMDDPTQTAKVAYPYNAIAGTIREYLTDLQMSMDRGRLAETILDNILRPLFLEMATTLVLQLGVIGKEAKVALGDEKFEDFNKMVLSVAQSKILDTMQRSYETAKEEARKALQR
jgi:hypothetical protein